MLALPLDAFSIPDKTGEDQGAMQQGLAEACSPSGLLPDAPGKLVAVGVMHLALPPLIRPPGGIGSQPLMGKRFWQNWMVAKFAPYARPISR